MASEALREIFCESIIWTPYNLTRKKKEKEVGKKGRKSQLKPIAVNMKWNGKKTSVIGLEYHRLSCTELENTKSHALHRAALR